MPVVGSLKSMSVDQLSNLQAQVEAALSAKVVEERRELEAKLSQLSRLSAGGGARTNGRGPGRGGLSLRGRTVAAKYRNPENPSETWAGRGLKPRWLTAAMKSGKKLEDFAIGGKSSAASKKMPKKTRGRPRKAA
jgi:DNA-binding protein H-NS